ncbi:Nef-associated protein 1 [Papilio machaon]|uniref:Nef-associated protein 1 n=1 Tax=Papilio machaon TaxID=76193 RepID=A0A0N0PCW2_PAPMA|nr:Nef-associated protein 1 [Papilio machaon]
MAENLEYYRTQIVAARTEIKNLRQRLSALKHEHITEIKNIKETLSGFRCTKCAATATTIVNNHSEGQPSTSDCTNIISFTPIGYIETPFENKRGVPRQPSVLSSAKGVINIDTKVFTNPEHAISGLEEFSHIWIIFHFHETGSTNVPAKVAPPRLGGERRGVLSTRSPHRPCPIGLSLVKISHIEGNKIHFEGIDMVNGTPVLDIKPYIPQYDSPTHQTQPNTPITERPATEGVMLDIKPYIPQYDSPTHQIQPNTPITERPATEGVSDAVDNITTIQAVEDNFDHMSLNSRLTNPLGIDAESTEHSPYDDELSQDSNLIATMSPSPDSQSSDMLDGNFQRSPLRRPDERGAPDGQERFTPPQYGVRVASWISNPTSQTYEVKFTDDALDRLNELIGDRARSFKRNIECLLSEDPRSLYVRSRYPDHEYSCVLEDLSISCIFDSSSTTCTIIAVRSADELQQT